MIYMLLGADLNILLNPKFIKVLYLGIKGAKAAGKSSLLFNAVGATVDFL